MKHSRTLLALLALACGASPMVRGEGEVIVRYSYCYGPSMLPTYGCAQPIKETFIPFDQLKIGMVVIYRNPFIRHDGKPTNHRLVHRLANGNWIARGDNNASADFGAVTRSNYVCITEPCADFVMVK